MQWTTDDFRGLTRAGGRFAAAEMLEFLARCDLLEETSEGWTLTEQGVEILEQLASAQWGRLGAAVLASGFYDDEMTRIVEAGNVTADSLRLPLARLPRLAPVAGAILAWQAEHREGSELVVPVEEFNRLLSLSAMEQAAAVPTWVEAKQSVGWRAELYSVRREITEHGADQVLHVSRDVGDSFGYDIERRVTELPRLIEVKGSRSATVSFVITGKELEVARDKADRYEIQFWGGISLARPANEEYLALVAAGYPIVIENPADVIQGGDWSVEAQSWRVSQEPEPDNRSSTSSKSQLRNSERLEAPSR